MGGRETAEIEGRAKWWKVTGRNTVEAVDGKEDDSRTMLTVNRAA